MMKLLLVFYCALGIVCSASFDDFDFDFSKVKDLIHDSDNQLFRGPKLKNGSLVFEQQEYLMWKGPDDLNTNATVFSINMQRSYNGFIKDKNANGIWLWFIDNRNQSLIRDDSLLNSSESFYNINDNDYIYGVNKKFDGFGIKLDELKLTTIFNEKKSSVEISNFNSDYQKLDYKYKLFYCNIPSSGKLSLRITFLNNHIYVEYSIENQNNFEFCFMYNFNMKNLSFLISGGLKEEKTVFTIDSLTLSEIKQIKDRNSIKRCNEDIKINSDLTLKIEVINQLSRDIYDKTKHLNSLFENFLYIHDHNINTLDKIKFDTEILNDIINENRNQTSLYESNSNHNAVDEKLLSLMEIIRNITFDKSSFIKRDSREILVKSFDDLRVRQNLMNESIAEMHKSTFYSLERINHKTEELETYKLFQQFLFLTIFINAVIMFAMYKNIKEREEKEKEGNNPRRENLKMAV